MCIFVVEKKRNDVSSTFLGRRIRRLFFPQQDEFGMYLAYTAVYVRHKILVQDEL